jgi:hypothetical protein
MNRSFHIYSGAWYFTPSQLKPGHFDTIMVKVGTEQFAIEFLHDTKGHPICQIAAFNDAFNALAACQDLIKALAAMFKQKQKPACPFEVSGLMEQKLGFVDTTETE